MVKRAAREAPTDATTVSQPVGSHDPHEVARFLREQPPVPIPPRTYSQPLPGLVAYALLGNRVIKT